MASYRPFPPQSSFAPPPSQNAVPPAQPPQQSGNQYNQSWGYSGGDGSIPSAPPSSFQDYNQMNSNSNYHHGGYGSSSSQHYGPPRSQQPPPPPPPSHQQYAYPPPPPPESSYPPPPPPPPATAPSMPPNSVNLQTPQAPAFYPSSQYSQYNPQPMQPAPPPPPPSSPPPGSSMPPPPPPSEPPPASALPHSQRNDERRHHDQNKGHPKEVSTSGRREHGHSNLGVPPKLYKPAVPPLPVKKSNVPSGRETEEEKRLRKKREFEKQRQEEKHRQQLKESQKSILQQTQLLSSGKGLGSIAGSRMGERRTTPLLTGERIENRLKKPTTFLCKLKFRNELPDPSAQPKLMTIKKDKDRYTKYKITSLEKMYEPQLYVEPDLGIPLDLLDLSVYNPPKEKQPLAPEDEDLIRDDESVTPVKKEGIRRKERPTDEGVSWLVKTQYISPLSTEATKQSLSEKQAKDLREMKGGRNILENRNNRERQIKEIEASFEAAKKPPVHATNKDLYPVEVMPLLPDFDRYDDQFVVAAFDSAPTADSEIYKKMDKTAREVHESRAIMKSYVATGSDPANPEKFLAYMVPSPGELSKDIYDEDEDVSYSWVREYNWDVRGDDADDPTTYLVSFDESEARYVPLPTKLVLKKKRAREGRSNDEVEQFPAPSRVTVRRRPSVATVELKDSGVHTNSKGSSSNLKRGRLDMDDGLQRQHRGLQHQDNYQSSGAEDDMSD
ncbi:RNA polymerase II-associated, Paf1 [Quillaja saponaria]|uniref:RNA polymerase II-associated, Paf1 n=1 Tax=Quillaja saponaria TaxID=32244 RepID=A0AAD7L521_QUISA|nr:RNA polymerase II-associated, Paf1 [Quillaja saponaria]